MALTRSEQHAYAGPIVGRTFMARKSVLSLRDLSIPFFAPAELIAAACVSWRRIVHHEIRSLNVKMLQSILNKERLFLTFC